MGDYGILHILLSKSIYNSVVWHFKLHEVYSNAPWLGCLVLGLPGNAFLDSIIVCRQSCLKEQSGHL